MQTRIDEIADGIYRLSTFVPEIAPPAGFTFNQFLVRGDAPLLFHTGPRAMFPLVREAVGKLMPVERLRWISFGHVEADECGAMNPWLAAAPHAEVVHGQVACDVSLRDLADRAPVALDDGQVLDLGTHRLRFLATPHVPHGWDAGVFHDETTGTLLCGDLFTHVGDGPALTEGDILGPALAAERMFGSGSLGPATVPTLQRLSRLAPRTLALMHGSSWRGDGAAALAALAEGYAGLIAEARGGAA